MGTDSLSRGVEKTWLQTSGVHTYFDHCYHGTASSDVTLVSCESNLQIRESGSSPFKLNASFGSGNWVVPQSTNKYVATSKETVWGILNNINVNTSYFILNIQNICIPSVKSCFSIHWPKKFFTSCRPCRSIEYFHGVKNQKKCN